MNVATYIKFYHINKTLENKLSASRSERNENIILILKCMN